MSYILADQTQEGVIETLLEVISKKQLPYLRDSSAKKKSTIFTNICKKAGLNPDAEDVAIAWSHIVNRSCRGLIK
jgi:hypothetical protein